MSRALRRAYRAPVERSASCGLLTNARGDMTGTNPVLACRRGRSIELQTTPAWPRAAAMGASLHASRFMPPPRPRVILADDHLIVAEGIARLLGEAFDVVETVEDGDALLEAAQSTAADVIVADVVMPRQSGLKVLKELRARGSDMPLVFLSMHSEPAVVSAAMRAGANGYVLKTKAGRELITALETVLSGSSYITPSL